MEELNHTNHSKHAEGHLSVDESSLSGSSDDEMDDESSSSSSCSSSASDDEDTGRVSPPRPDIRKQGWSPWVGARVRVLFDKERWYGGRIEKVPSGTAPNGRILYDDGTRGTFKLHDSDVVVEMRPPTPPPQPLLTPVTADPVSTVPPPHFPSSWSAPSHDDSSLEEGEIRQDPVVKKNPPPADGPDLKIRAPQLHPLPLAKEGVRGPQFHPLPAPKDGFKPNAGNQHPSSSTTTTTSSSLSSLPPSHLLHASSPSVTVKKVVTSLEKKPHQPPSSHPPAKKDQPPSAPSHTHPPPPKIPPPPPPPPPPPMTKPHDGKEKVHQHHPPPPPLASSKKEKEKSLVPSKPKEDKKEPSSRPSSQVTPSTSQGEEKPLPAHLPRT